VQTLQTHKMILADKRHSPDTNRQRVVECKGIEPIMRHLDNDDLFEIAVPVLYNICVDFGKSTGMHVTELY
jgi:hypothetical protein